MEGCEFGPPVIIVRRRAEGPRSIQIIQLPSVYQKVAIHLAVVFAEQRRLGSRSAFAKFDGCSMTGISRSSGRSISVPTSGTSIGVIH